MKHAPGPAERLFRALMRLHTRAFRDRYEDEMLRFFHQAWHEEVEGRGLAAALGFWTRTIAGAIRTGVAQRLGPGRRSGSDLNPAGRDPWVTDLVRDARYAARSLRRRPGFAVVTILTLALGIGANAAVFSVLHSVLLAPLPYDEPDQLVRMYWEEPDEIGVMPGAAFLDFRQNLQSIRLAAIYNYRETGADLVVEGQPTRVRTLFVSADYFDVLRADIPVGRAFLRAEEREDARVAIVSEQLWRNALGGDRQAVGGMIRLDDVRYEVVGIVSATFEDPVEGDIDVWLPENMQPGPTNDWENDRLTVLGRLAPSVPMERARSEVAARSRAQMEEHPRSREARGVLVPLREDLLGSTEPMLITLMGAAMLLLIITCVNVTSLVLARSAARSSEFAIRSALGSGGGRLVRQLLVESLVLAAAGGAAGLIAGAAIQETLVATAPAALPSVTTLGYGGPVALFAGALALLVGLALGVVPAWQLMHTGLASRVGRETRGGGERVDQQRVRKTLVVAQVSLALVLLIGAGLLLASLQQLRSVDLGVDATDVMTFQVHLPTARYADPEERVRFHEMLHERLASLPGVQAVGAASRLPATGSYHPWGAQAANEPDRRSNQAQQRVVQGDWFEALDIRLLEGRLFGRQEGPDDPRRVVVSASLARRLFPDRSAIGQRITVFGDPLEVIGVVEDVALTRRGEAAPTVYHAHEQFAANRNWPLFQVVEVAGPIDGLIGRARTELEALDASLVLVEPHPLDAMLGREISRDRFTSLLVTAFAVLAVVLAGLGIYGILAYDVSRSRREIGVRMALGAGAAQVKRMVILRGLRLTSLGVLLGFAAALGASRFLEVLLFRMSATDPWIFGIATGAVALLGLVASWLPARRATAVEPAEAFRAT